MKTVKKPKIEKMKKFRNPAILLGSEPINSLGVVRNLGKMGVDVYYVSEKSDSPICSKYCKKYFIVPNIEHGSEILRSFLIKLKKEIGGHGVIFPSSDMFCLSLSQLKEEIEDDYYVSLPKYKIVETLINKKKFYQSISKHKIPHPKTYFLESYRDIEKMDEEVNYPVFIKPSISQTFSQIFNKKGFIARSKDELTRYYRLASRYDKDVMIQEIISGPTFNLFCINGYFDRNSNPLGFFAYRKLREWPNTFGTGSLIESVPISDVSSIKKITEKYLHSLGYHGMIDAEFKIDPRDNHFKLIEINPRSWWQNTLPTKCGINLFFMAYLDIIGENVDYAENYVAGVKWIHLFNDLRSSIKLLSNKEIKLSEWLSSLHNIKDWGYFSTDDPLPGITRPLFIMNAIKDVLHSNKT